MFIFKNAFISITRNRGRNILIGAIVLVIACACTITLAISNTANDLIDSYESAYEKELTISFNRENIKNQFDFSDKDSFENAKNAFSEIEPYTIDDVEKFATSDRIKNYYYTYNISLDGKSIKKAETPNKDEPSSSLDGVPKNIPGGIPNGERNIARQNSLDFALTGYSSLESMSEFIDGTYTMTEIKDNAWDIAFDGDYIFINEELALYNNLSIGSKVKLQDENNHTFEFEVIGIFKDNDMVDDGTISMFSNSANTIITNVVALTKITTKYADIPSTVNPTFIIDSYDSKDEIQQAFYDQGLNEDYIVETNEEVVNSSLESVDNIRSFAKTFLIITLIIGGIVLFILNMINIRERKYEIGVFRTIGISKLKLTAQFVTELSMIAIISLTLGAGIGAAMSKSVSNSLLASEVASSTEKMEDVRNNFGGGRGGNVMPNIGSMDMPKFSGGPNVQAYDSIDAIVNIKVLLELFVIGLSLVLISSLAAMISIQRFSPLTILKERS